MSACLIIVELLQTQRHFPSKQRHAHSDADGVDAIDAVASSAAVSPGQGYCCGFMSWLAREASLKIIIEIIGWTAAVMMLSAYLLLTSGRLRSLSPTYQWLNVLSGAGFIVNSGWNGAYPSATLNLIWMAIGLYGLFRGARMEPGPAA